jgi:carotenoid 1,2-hydratase
MPGKDIRGGGTLRPAHRAARQGHRDDHAEGFRPAFSSDRRSALRPGVARMDGFFPSSGLPHPDAGSLSGGWQHASGSGSADGGDVRPPSGGGDTYGLRFDTPVPRGGYVWWYVDALSADGRNGLSIIAFIGSVFSPYYAFARSRGIGDPLNHCALNVAFYTEGGKHWAMTERGRKRVRQTASLLTIGPSMVTWHRDVLTIRIEETTAPIPLSLRGTVRVYPKAIAAQAFDLDPFGRHIWQPIAPCAHVEVMMSQPNLRWHGAGYVDTNRGLEPLEEAFQSWTWSRAETRSGTAVLYDVKHRARSTEALALLFTPTGDVEVFDPPRIVGLPPTRWKIARQTRADRADSTRVVKTLESAPFYARSLISTYLLGSQALAVHESLSLERFRAGWVHAMLPFRMPRALW